MRSGRKNLEADVEALGSLSRDELVLRWHKIYRCPPPSGVRRELLIRAAAWHLQAKRLGGHSAETRRLLRSAMERVELKNAKRSNGKPSAETEPSNGQVQTTLKPRRKLSPGARLLRDWNGKTHVVDVIDTGFAFEAKVYPSLSAIAKQITGAHWSGPRFFGL
jgi:hypothetical protein